MPVNNFRIETTLSKLLKKREQLASVRDSIKEYAPLESENITNLKEVIKGIREQIKEEEKMILSEYRDDQNYINMRDKEIMLKAEVSDLSSELKDLLKDIPLPHNVGAVQCLTDGGEKVNVQLEKLLKVSLNGKKLA